MTTRRTSSIRAIICSRSRAGSAAARFRRRATIGTKAAIFPIFRTEQELAVIRGAARLLTATSPIAVGILTTLTNYVIGNGFQYAVAATADGDSYFTKIASRVIDEFLEENGWSGDLDRELFQRSRVDGEYFLGLWHVGDGHVQARAVEPDQVTEPSNKSRHRRVARPRPIAGQQLDVRRA